MKRIFLTFTLVLALLAAVGCGVATKTTAAAGSTPAAGTTKAADTSLSDVQKRGKLEIGMSGQYPPFAYRQEDGKLIGFDIDITTEIARRLNVQPDYVTMPFKGLIAALDASRFDLIANQMAITPERQQRYAFSNPYVQSGSQLLVAKSNTTINSLADVKGKTFAASEGSNYEKILKDAGAKIQYYTNNATIYSDIVAGRVDGDMNDRLQVAYLVEHSGLPLRAAGDPGQKVPVALMFRQGNDTLVNAVNKAFADMQADGTFLKISQKWFGQDVSK